jgi:hypothetical protein
MRLQTPAVLIASFVLLAAPVAHAIPFCEKFPDSPICNPEDPDPCEVDPASCEPDPCELDPGSCEPDPCELDPASCEPDPCELDPASCEPEPEPEDYSHAADFVGSYLVKSEGVKRSVPEEPELLFNQERFVLIFDKDAAFEGTLVPKGKKGKKFQLIFDDAAAEAFAQFVAEEMGVAAGRPAEPTVGETSKLVFVLRDDQTAVLRVKSQVVESDGDEIVFKMKVSGTVAPVVKG